MNGSSLSVILLPTLHCNACCDYCFEDSNSGRMDLEAFSTLLEKIFDFMVERDIALLNMYWQGGEVFTLSPDWFYHANDRMQAIAERRSLAVANYLQSNLLAYSEAWEPVIGEIFGGSVGTSMDFPNRHRRTPGNSPEDYTARWKKNVAKVVEAGFSVGVIAVPSAETLELGAEAFYDFFVEEIGVFDFQVNPPFAGGALNEAKRNLPLDAHQLGQFLVELSDIWLSRGFNNGVKVGPSSEILDYFLHGNSVIPCFWQDNCANNFICIDPHGNVSQCDCWVASYPEMHFGNLFEASSLATLLDNSAARRKFLSRPASLVKNRDCVECEYLAFCHGGCPVRAYATSGVLPEKDPYCQTYKLLFSHLESVAGRIAASRIVGGK